MRQLWPKLVGTGMTTVALMLWSGQAWAQAVSVEELKRELEKKDRQIRELTDRIERLEQMMGTRPAAPAVAAPAASPGAQAVASAPAEEPGSKLKVSIGGYVKLDLQYADRDLGGSNLNLGPGSTPLRTTSGDAAQQGRFSADARETRVNVELSGPVRDVRLQSRVQVDFYGNEDSALTNTGRVIRLREAFARADVPLGSERGWYVLAGQTTSTFSNTDIAAPDTVDANGPAGILGARQPQLRLGYRLPVGSQGSSVVFEAAAQQHSFSNFSTGNAGTTPRTATDGQGQALPLFAGKVQWLTPLFQVETAAAMGRNKGVFEKADRGHVATRSETAWGMQLSGQVVPWEPVTLFAHYQHLDGLNREGNGDFQDVVSEAHGGGVFRLRNIETDGWYAGLAFRPWGDTTLNFIYGQNRADEDVAGAFTGRNTIRRQRSIHANIMQKFWSQWRLGAEYQRFLVDSFGRNPQDGSVNFYHGGLWFFY